jgi:hypothetical protein
MMEESVGVIVGRFQEHKLKEHEGHVFTIDYVTSRHRKVLMLLAEPGAYRTDRYPLPFNSRKMMIRGEFKDASINIVPIESNPGTYAYRSSQVDEIIAREYPGQEAIVYGSRDSILDTYCGVHGRGFVPHITTISATQIRESIQEIDSDDFRAGIIWDILHRPPIAYPTIDVAAAQLNSGRGVLVKKKGEGKYRFPGVFYDPTLDTNFESAGHRACSKELPGINVSDMRILFSHKIDDPRYRKSRDGVITLMALATCDIHSNLQVAHEMEHAQWFDLEKITPDLVVPEHRVLAEKMRNYW